MQQRLNFLVGLVVSGVVGLSAEVAYAYPQYIAKGYATCGSCHYNADGGGALNAYGAATVEAMIPEELPVTFVEELREVLGKVFVSGYDDDDLPAFQWDVGLDSRLLLVGAVTDIGGSKEPYIIPMLMEAHSVAGWGRWGVYGSVGPRKTSSPDGQDHFFMHSRYHWLQYRASDEVALRFGKMVVPFGLKIPDHTVTTRKGLGFDKYDQSYGAMLDWQTESLALGVMAFAGESPWKESGLQERGLSVSISHLIPGRAAIGFSGLYGDTGFSTRLIAGLHARVQGPAKTYCLIEGDLERKGNTSAKDPQLQFVGYTRLGWFPRGWLDVFAELRYLDFLPSGSEEGEAPRELGAMLGLNWQVLPWVELSPGVMLNQLESGAELTWLGQLHFVY